jgi:hypothetical protein
MNVASDQDGNVYAVGYFSNTADFDPGAGELNLTSNGDYDICMIKYNPAGQLLWAHSFGSGERDFGAAVSVDGNGDVVFVGNFGGTVDFDPGPDTFELSSSSGSRDIFVLKLTSDGDFIWGKSLGGSQQEDGRCVTSDESGNVYVSGFFQGLADMDPGEGELNLNSFGGQDAFITKLDTDGNFVWSKQFSGSSNERSFDIAVDQSENVIATGQFAGTTDFDPGEGNFNLTASGNDAFVVKLSNNGDFEWAKQIGGFQTDQGQGVDVNDAGEIYAVGNFQNTVDIDPGDGEQMVASQGSYDSYVLKLDVAGETIWAKSFGDASVELSRSVALDTDENIYITGQFANFTDLNPGEEDFELTSNGSYDSFVSMLNPAGEFQWGIHMGSSNTEDSKGVTVDDNGNIYSGGNYTATADFDPSEDVFNSPNMGSNDLYVHKYTMAECNGVPELTLSMESAEQNDTICAGSETSLDFFLETDYFDFPGISYQWQFDAGNGWENTEDSLGTTYSAISPNVSTDYRVVITCDSGGDSFTTNVVSITIENSPEVSITPSSFVFCGEGEATLTALGAQNYSWSPADGLSETDGTTVSANPSEATTYTVSGASANGCVSTATAFVSPISVFTAEVEASPNAICESGQEITFSVTNIPEGVSGGGEWEYQWTDTESAVIQDWSTESTYSFTPATSGQFTFFVSMRNTTCDPEETAQGGSATVEVGFGATVNPLEINCDTPGSFSLSNVFGQFSTETFYSNDFTSSIEGQMGVETFLTAQTTDGRMVLTESLGNVKGGFYIDPGVNEIDVANAEFEVDFLLSVDQSFNGGGNAFAYSFADDAQFINIGNLGHGLGSKLRLVFDPVSSPGASTPNFQGVYLVYGLQQNGQQVGETSDAFVAYEPSITPWFNATDMQVNIKITPDGKATVQVGGTTIFDQVQLPDDYINEDKSDWGHLFSANTPGNGSSGNRFAIDDLNIVYKNMEFGITMQPNTESPEQWQASSVFEGLEEGIYNIWMRNPSDTACASLIDSVEIVIEDLPTITVSPSSAAVCEGDDVNLTASGAETYQWSPEVELNQTNTASVTSTPTQQRNYLVTGIDSLGCVNSTSITVIPVSDLTVSTQISSAPICEAGELVVLDADGAPEGVSGGGSWQYQWLNADSTIAQAWSLISQFTFTPNEEGEYTYLLEMRNSACPEDTIQHTGLAVATVGFGAAVDSIEINCNRPDGSLILSDVFGQYGSEVYYSNDFSGTIEGDTTVNTYIDAALNDNRMVLVESGGNLFGGFEIDPAVNDVYWSDAAYEISFSLTADQPFNGGGNSFAYSFGDDAGVIDIPNLGHGLGSKLRLVFDPTESPGANPTPNYQGIYLVYGMEEVGQQVGPTSNGFVAFNPNNMSWFDATDVPVNLSISVDGKATVKVGGVIVFDQVQLPQGFVEEDKSNWYHSFTANTAGNSSSGNRFAIDDLEILYKGIEFGINDVSSTDAPDEWQNGRVFDGLSEGGYNLWIGNPSDPTCNKLIGSYYIDDINPVVDLGTDSTLCVGESVTLEAGNEESAVSYMWNDDSTESTLTATTTGGYWVMVTDTAGCFDIGSILLNFLEPSTVDGISVENNGLDAIVTADNPQNVDTYDWDFGDGTVVTSSSPVEFHTYPDYGDYEVMLTVSGGASCASASLSQTISIITSVNELSGEDISLIVYPNPAQDEINLISDGDAGIVKIELINSIGQTVYAKEVNNLHDKQIDATKLENGLYFLKAYTKNSSHTLRVVIAR